MPLLERLHEDLKDAMRKGDENRKMTIRLLLSAINYQQIADQKTLDDDGILKVLAKQIKQREESIEAFRLGKRDDLVRKEEAELAIIRTYMPQQMTDDELAALIKKAIEQSGAKSPQDMGKVMGILMPQIKGRADGKRVSTVVSSMLKARS